MSAWAKQLAKQVKKHGKRKASWNCEWNEPDGTRRIKSCGPGPDGRRLAELMADRIKSQLKLGTYESDKRADKTWLEFREEYLEKVASRNAAETYRVTVDALNHFERIAKPKLLRNITTQTIDKFVAARQKERGLRKGDTVSPATVNKELRVVRAAVRKARKWKFLAELPEIEFIREPGKLVRYITPEDFAKIYQACDAAQRPVATHYSPCEWWRALLMFTYMTGWRISEPLALRRDDLDLDAGEAVTRAADNKGKRDDRVPLHPVVIEHLRAIQTFDDRVFVWEHHKRQLYDELLRIQQTAGIHLPCHEQHEHTPSCHVYGFHDCRRAFATMNAESLSGNALQALMRHKSYATTQKYISMARHLKQSADKLFVPSVSVEVG
ncbi:MAG: tyrosine-type recombinase/integrase [Planctomycetaceae bacterium]|jgi:integrase|nr:tyrosine-type recombinase/integrase [Planctomycetaceae bacterium]MBT6485390.1 tyrosine-type recombinase/integrase [Planctomycetaceae bacterium]MBT6494344.1 tyrosine-type recombinase/integrase [Planctomycetaceae bacterium]